VNFTFDERVIDGVLTVLPSRERSFLEHMTAFKIPVARAMKLAAVMGYDKQRLVEAGTCVSDLAIFGLRHLFEKGWADPGEIDAMILVTQSPDHFMPATSNIIQGALGLKQDMLCLDINQGCAGFVVGLLLGFQLLDQPSIQTVALVNADVLSHKVSPRDKSSYPLVGDAASVTILRRRPGAARVHANLKMDGKRHAALMIPAGGFRRPSTPETAVQHDSGDNNWRSEDNLQMSGTDVFNFVQTEVPPMIDDLLKAAGVSRDQVDSFIFHQPNRFMLQKLAEAMDVPEERMPNNIVENFGNASGVTIPTNLCFNLATRLRDGTLKLCIAGFGVGLTWASMMIDVGPVRFCELIDYQ
jgi:3-oxoacyl-[acyl-carrier-protein] synthase-3